MYKILIADDEGIVTQALQFIIEKNFGSSCELRIAKNGRQAIELAEHFHPDIALLDIQMPGINGLKAIEEIRNFNPDMKALILTAYDNFEYVKTALRLGAVDYLTKPINKDLLVSQLRRVMEDIDKKRQKQKLTLREIEKLETALPIVESGFVLSLIIQTGTGRDMDRYRELLDIGEARAMVMVLQGREIEGAAVSERTGQMVKARFQRVFVCGGIYGKTVCVLPASADFQEETVLRKAQALRQDFQEKLAADVKIGMGGLHTWENMASSYQEALNALRHGEGPVTHSNRLVIRFSESAQRRMEDAVVKAVTSGMEHDTRREALVYTGWMGKNSDLSWEEKRTHILGLYLLARRAVQSRSPAEGIDALPRLLEAQGEGALVPAFVEALAAMARSVVIRQETTNHVIEKSKAFIQQNFHRDLPLEEVSQVAGLSPYYFSKIFKEITGSNYSEYLTSLRIDTAKKLLSSPDVNIKQVCLHVGYTDPNYFSRIFKKYTGLTPTEFRNEL